MSAHTMNFLSIGPASRFAQEKQQESLTASIDELAGLRFSILLTARWEASDAIDLDRRSDLRAELADLRRLYFDKLDEIAMTFGVDHAINARESVESAVTVPVEMNPPIETGDAFDASL